MRSTLAKLASIACPPSPDACARRCRRNVLMVPSLEIRRMRRLPLSLKYRFPAASKAMPLGRSVLRNSPGRRRRRSR
jgi:hypothetical protein